MNAAPAREHDTAVARWLPARGVGVEIGAFTRPIPGIAPYYVDRFATYAGEACRFDYLGDACSLPFHDHSLDYVASSHLLEHVANPVQALAEWGRVLRPGGVIYAVIPDRRRTWDRERELTPVEHLLEDFRRGVDQTDGAHVDEFVSGVVWPEFRPGGTEADKETYREQLQGAVRQGLEVNIHFHTFEPLQFGGLLETLRRERVLGFELELLALEEAFPASCPNGFLVVARVVPRGWRPRVRGWSWRLRRAWRRDVVVRADAKAKTGDGEIA